MERQDTILVLEPRTYSVRVERTGYEPFETSRAVARGDTVVVSVRLQRVQPVEPVTPPQPAAQCLDPRLETYNRDGSCFDTPPRANEAPLIPLPEGVRGQLRTVLWVSVLADGTVGRVDWNTRSGNPLFDLAASQYAQRRLTYTPAQKAGRPVSAWFALPVVGRPR
jgi:hypothetical protein